MREQCWSLLAVPLDFPGLRTGHLRLRCDAFHRGVGAVDCDLLAVGLCEAHHGSSISGDGAGDAAAYSQALALVHHAKMSADRKRQLETVNREMEKELTERWRRS